jgi:hypothetical protein
VRQVLTQQRMQGGAGEVVYFDAHGGGGLTIEGGELLGNKRPWPNF